MYTNIKNIIAQYCKYSLCPISEFDQYKYQINKNKLYLYDKLVATLPKNIVVNDWFIQNGYLIISRAIYHRAIKLTEIKDPEVEIIPEIKTDDIGDNFVVNNKGKEMIFRDNGTLLDFETKQVIATCDGSPEFVITEKNILGVYKEKIVIYSLKLEKLQEFITSKKAIVFRNNVIYIFNNNAYEIYKII